ncbi:DENN domain and WD repeat-containing protein SCD1-like isoform X2 [Silene latifolia]
MILFTAVLLERRILLRSDKYSLLTLVSEAICHLIYPFQWQHVYVPILFSEGVDFVDAPTPYIIGLHSSVDTSDLLMDGVVIVDIDHNFIVTSEEIPSIPEPELHTLRSDIMNLLYPNLLRIDEISVGFGQVYEKSPPVKLWGEDHDLKLRLIFLKFFAKLLSGYRNFVGNTTDYPFDDEAFILERSHLNNELPDAMISQFLGSQGFSNYIGRVVSGGDSDDNVLDKLIDATKNGHDLMSIFPSSVTDPIIITIPDPTNGIVDSSARYIYNKFPANVRAEKQVEKRNQFLRYMREKNDQEAQLIRDIKVKLKGLWFNLAKLEAADAIVSSDEYETILALIETDSQGLVGSAFIEGIREHMNSGWNCKLSEKLFIAVKELVKGVIIRAFTRNDMRTVRDALEVSAEIYRSDLNGVPDYIQRHLLSLSIWENIGFWKTFFDYLLEQSSIKSSSKENLIVSQLMLVALHMGGLGVPDTIAWPLIEYLARTNYIEFDLYVQLRGYLSYIHQLHMAYWGLSDSKVQSLSLHSMQSQQDVIHDSQQPAIEVGYARNWVRSMFGKEAPIVVNPSSHGQGLAADSETSGEIGTPRRQNFANARQRRIQSSVRVIRGHDSTVTALHCVTKREVWDLVAAREDSGFFFTGSTDCSVKIWDPSRRGSELLATMKGHTGAVRAISSDRQKVVSGSDDLSILIWDKHEFTLLEELKSHQAPISYVRMLSGERVLSSSHDGTVKMWDARIGSCIATVGHCPGAVLCTEYDDSTGILAAAGRDSMVHIWDIRAGRHVHKLQGHTKWIRSIRMDGDRVITGSDDWTARIWSISRGECDAVLAHHAGPVHCVEFSEPDNGIITGSDDGSIRFWETADNSIKCAKEMYLNSSILSINAAEEWLGIGTADNAMLLFNQPVATKSQGWQLYKTPKPQAAVIRCMASDLEHKRICSGGRDGLLRIWDATVNV